MWWMAALTALAADVTVPVQARVLTADGAEATQDQQVTVTLHRSETATDVAYTESFADVPLTNGVVTVVLGDEGGLDHTLLTEPLWADLTLNGATLTPRMPIGSAPLAARAEEAAIRHDSATFTNYSSNPANISDWTDTGHELALPAAGTYLVTYSAETFRSAGTRPDLARMRMWSTTIDADVVPGGVIRGVAGVNGQTNQSHGNAMAQVIVTVAAAETVKIQVRDQHGGNIQLFSANMSWMRLD